MFALTTIVINPGGGMRIERGSLFQIPVELRSHERIQKYIAIAKPGWVTDDWGYHLFSRYLSSGELLILPGIQLTDGKRAKRRVQAYTMCFSRQQIEEFVGALENFSQSEMRRIQNGVNMLIHDLRSLSTTILHANNEARIFLRKDIEEADVRIGNVEAAQGILRMRIDAFDLIGNSNAILRHKVVPVFRKVDKVVRFFKCSAALENKQIYLRGQSRRTLFGPDVFELVPFSIIDNAVKYSPKGHPIEVMVTEDDRTRLTITSLGPKIKKSEEVAIFSTGVRGSGAIETGLPGTGVGLHLVSRIVKDFFRGEIWVQQSQNTLHIDGQDFFETTFTVDMPTNGVNI